MPERIGSIIKLKPEVEKEYITLHQNTFPGVLRQIQKSNIRNYSIFLQDHILFSYYEYIGTDRKSDMEKMASDSETRRWWKLTDPMQEPFSFRAPDEWWTVLENILLFEIKNFDGKLQRISLRTKIEDDESGITVQNRIASILAENNAGLISLYKVRNLIFLYAEISATLNENHLISDLNEAGMKWKSSREVFHTD